MRRHQIQQLAAPPVTAGQFHQHPRRRVGVRRRRDVCETPRAIRPQQIPKPSRHLRDPMGLPPETPIRQTVPPADRLPARTRQPHPHQSTVEARRQRPAQPRPPSGMIPTSARIRHRAQQLIRHPHQTRHPASDLSQQAVQAPQLRTRHQTRIQRRGQRHQPLPRAAISAQRLHHAHLRIVGEHPPAPAACQHPHNAVNRHHTTPRTTSAPAASAPTRKLLSHALHI